MNLARVHLNRAVAINPYNSVLLCQLSVVEQALHNNAVVNFLFVHLNLYFESFCLSKAFALLRAYDGIQCFPFSVQICCI